LLKEVNGTHMHSNDAELYILAHEVRILASILSKVANRDVEQRIQACGANISGLQHGLLRLLRDHPYTSSELSRKMMLTPATLVPAVDALERHGLVERGRDPNDRRRTPLVVTGAGRSLLERVPMVNDDDALVQSLRSMDREKGQHLLAALRELVAMLLNDPAHVQAIGESVQQMVQEHQAGRSQA